MNSFRALYSNSGQYENQWRDRYERDRYFNSGNQEIFEPVLSKRIAQQGFLPHYPAGKEFAVCISHDIDHLYHRQTKKRKLLNVAGAVARGRGAMAIRHAQSLFKDEVYPEFELNRLIELNNAFHLKSSYYFLSLNPGEEDFAYDLGEIQNQLRLVASNGCEIGLHGGHQAYKDAGKILAEKEKLESQLISPVKGYRNHYLRFQVPYTWHHLAKAGFLYDTTFGYADCAGFRNGMCYPHFPYDGRQGQFLDIVELPLIMMDATLFYYMRLDIAGSVALCRKLVDEVRKCGGVFTLLWHNNSLSGELGQTYKKILETLSEYDPWFATSAELVEWWKNEKLLDRSHSIVKGLVDNE